MLKPIHIICLFALLGVGLAACERDVVTVPDNTPQQYYFLIKDIAEYNVADYYINPTTFHFPQGVDTSIYYHLDDDGIYDLKFTHWDTAFSGGGYVHDIKMHDLTADSILNFSVKSVYPSLHAHAAGDTINSNNINWSNANLLTVSYGDYYPPSETWYEYNWASSTNKMVGFRKMIDGQYKYGWIIIDISTGTYGPSVIER